MRVAPYIRVSTEDQAKEGYSLSAQEERISAYAKYQGYELLPTYIDDGFSGSSINRPGLQKMIENIKMGKIDMVIVYKLDRLSRRVRDVIDLVELFQGQNITFYSLSENIDLTSPFGRAVLKFSATVAEMERETIAERFKLGKEERARQGKMMATGNKYPFGYVLNKEKKCFDIIPEEAEMVKKLFQLYLQGYSFRALYDYAKKEFNHPYFNNYMCCKPIIHRSMYAGYFSFKGVLYKGVNFEPIITMETYLLAQQQIEKNKSSRSNDNSPYLLTGLLICGSCGHRYVGKLYDRYSLVGGVETKRYKYTAYGCASRVKRDKRYDYPLCKNKIYKTEELEKFVVESLKSLHFNEFVSGDYQIGFIDKMVLENQRLQTQIEKLLDLYLNDGINKDLFVSKTHEVEKQLEKNKNLINNTTQKINCRPTATIEFIKEKISDFDNLEKREKRLILSYLIENIIINDDKIYIKWRVK